MVGGGWPGSGLPVSPCRDSHWAWDGVQFSLYSIGRHCVLRAATRGAALLLAGDLDADAERALLARLPSAARASDIVLVSRQASGNGSSSQWIEKTAPGLAIAAGGIKSAKSRAQVLARWRRQGSRVFDSRQEGAMELDLDARGYELRVISTTRYPFHWRR